MMQGENLDVFLDGPFGVDVASGVLSGRAILDMPGAELADGSILSTQYAITVKAEIFKDLKYADPVTISGSPLSHANGSFKVRHPIMLDDGAFICLVLSKD
jgi:hypothetical protein